MTMVISRSRRIPHPDVVGSLPAPGLETRSGRSQVTRCRAARRVKTREAPSAKDGNSAEGRAHTGDGTIVGMRDHAIRTAEGQQERPSADSNAELASVQVAARKSAGIHDYPHTFGTAVIFEPLACKNLAIGAVRPAQQTHSFAKARL
ncbi:hypothetical protein [Arthrobacter burdickii]|uniref:Uncharacterized protein n=1 Tax=Arthrobacter burdickii TaxID=3035920 RepID=A0ABT8K1T0_9MICC|nr:hypothetical protein [Arthrobacter burdickii]MDN4610334.1 hypothetical protein [Arthrobacter burdickii]